MGQINKILRRSVQGYIHWCPGCEDTHTLFDSWKFNGDIDKPTFTPSFKHQGFKTIDIDGKWTGEWVRDDKGKPIPYCCHYILTNGILNFCRDSTHKLAGQSVPLPDLPAFLQDP